MDEIAVIGPGLMGRGIALVCATAGLRVWLLGRDAASASAGRERLAQALARQVERGKLEGAQADALMMRIEAAPDDSCLARCGAAIESAPEDRPLKEAVLQRLQAGLPPGAWIATNTSGLPVTGLAAALADPARFIGLHFFSPVDRMKLVEVVRGQATSAATLASALALLSRLGQVPVVVRDGPGFFTSRVFAAYLDEAIAMVGEGVDPVRVDAAGLRLGRAIAPLALLDDIGLSLNLQQARQARADGLPPERCRLLAEPVLAALVGAGRRGRRDGGGFYDMADDGGRRPWAGLGLLFPPTAQSPDDDTLALRLRCSEALEALRCLEQGVVQSADDADTASLLGLGFPRAQGGILRWCERHGLAQLVADAQQLARTHGTRFETGSWLRERAADPQGLTPWRQVPNERKSS